MPTRGRQALAAKALRCFLSQTYEPKNLYIVDDADDPSFPNWIPMVNVSRVVVPPGMLIYAKRNLACEMASGELLMHFDSDDFSAPERMTDQVRRIEESGKPVTAYHSMLFCSEHLAWYYQGMPNHPIGTSLCYKKTFWNDHRFEAGKDPKAGPNVEEDTQFGKAARDRGLIITVEAAALMVARVHSGNTSNKSVHINNPYVMEYKPVPMDVIPQGVFA